MADLTPGELREITRLAQEAQINYRDMALSIERAAAGQASLAAQVAVAKERQTALSSIAKKISEFNEKDFQSKQKQAAFFREIDKLQAKRLGLERQLKQVQELKKNATNEERKALGQIAKDLKNSLLYTEELYQNTRLIERKFRDIDRSSSWIEGLSNLTRSIPLIGPAIEDIATSWRKASGYLNENKSNLEKTGIVLKSLSTIIVASLIRNVFKLNQDITEFARNTEITQKAANKATGEYRNLAREVKGLTAADLAGSATAFSKELGVSVALSADLAKTGAILTKRFGVTADQAAKLQKLTLATNQDFGTFANGIIGSVEAYNALNKTAFSTNEIFQSISNLGAANTVSINRFKNGLVDAAVEAKKLGTTLKGIEGIQETLLNFEQSIAAELEAELLTGRQINLERARYYALTNDLEGLTREIANNVGSLAEFEQMNYFAQVSTAKTYGMQRDQLAEMLMQQEALEEIRKRGYKTEEDYTKELTKQLNQAKTREEREKIIQKFGDTELARRISQVSAQERLNELQEKIATSLAERVLPVLERVMIKLEEVLRFIGGGSAGQGIENVATGVGAVAAVGVAVKAGQAIKKIKGRIAPSSPAAPPTPTPTPSPTSPTVSPQGTRVGRSYPSPNATQTPTSTPTGKWTWSQKLGRYQFRNAATGRLMSTSGAPPMPRPPSTGIFSRVLSRLRGGGGGRAGLITGGLMALGFGASAMSSEEEPETIAPRLTNTYKPGTPEYETMERVNAKIAKYQKPQYGTADPFSASFELLFKLYDVLSKVDTSNKEVARTVTEQTSYRYAVEGL